MQCPHEKLSPDAGRKHFGTSLMSDGKLLPPSREIRDRKPLTKLIIMLKIFSIIINIIDISFSYTVLFMEYGQEKEYSE